jgi:DNA processing protein
MAEDRVAAATLAGLPGITPVRLDALLARFHGPARALAAVAAGRAWEAFAPGDRALAREWATAADPERVEQILRHRRCQVLVVGAPDYPIAADLPGRPPVLFAEGDRAEVLQAPRVGVVGTRAATPHGLADARDLGAFLAAAGVTVVSGLAIGIDGAVHTGALDAGGGVVGVVATGLDIAYPRRHTLLHQRVRTGGLLVGEHWLGVPPIPARFPVRNRIIAALADVVVVVEATSPVVHGTLVQLGVIVYQEDPEPVSQLHINLIPPDIGKALRRQATLEERSIRQIALRAIRSYCSEGLARDEDH